MKLISSPLINAYFEKLLKIKLIISQHNLILINKQNPKHNTNIFFIHKKTHIQTPSQLSQNRTKNSTEPQKKKLPSHHQTKIKIIQERDRIKSDMLPSDSLAIEGRSDPEKGRVRCPDLWGWTSAGMICQPRDPTHAPGRSARSMAFLRWTIKMQIENSRELKLAIFVCVSCRKSVWGVAVYIFLNYGFYLGQKVWIWIW